jgi:Lon protease-like protein
MDVMMLRSRGGERFRILETRALADLRLEARIEMIAADRDIPISDMHVSCAKTLKLVLDDIDAKGQAEHGDAFDSPFARPMQLESAAWVANRWCEILPIPLKARQKLLELDNAHSRLSIVYQYLQQHKIL